MSLKKNCSKQNQQTKERVTKPARPVIHAGRVNSKPTASFPRFLGVIQGDLKLNQTRTYMQPVQTSADGVNELLFDLYYGSQQHN